MLAVIEMHCVCCFSDNQASHSYICLDEAHIERFLQVQNRFLRFDIIASPFMLCCLSGSIFDPSQCPVALVNAVPGCSLSVYSH